MAESARSVYVADRDVGELAWLRGHWLDRLPAIDTDIADMAKRLDAPLPLRRLAAKPTGEAIAAALAIPARAAIDCSHTPEPHLRDHEPLYIELETKSGHARLWYRHFNQAEQWQSTQMLRLHESDRFRASIDAAYTASPYPIQYYFEVRSSSENVWLYPGFDAARANQPYYLVRPL